MISETTTLPGRMMDDEYAVEFGGSCFYMLGEAALYWPGERALLLADLHLEKGSHFAITGQMLPPYDSLATLQSVEKLAAICRPRNIISLGDNFHDDGGEARLSGDAAAILSRLTAQYDWIWIVGNHDPLLSAKWGGVSVNALKLGAITLRHDVSLETNIFEISGHFHPKLRIHARGHTVSRRCFVEIGKKLIMPAFGALTGGMDAADVAGLIGGDVSHGVRGAWVRRAWVARRNGVSYFPLPPTE